MKTVKSVAASMSSRTSLTVEPDSTGVVGKRGFSTPDVAGVPVGGERELYGRSVYKGESRVRAQTARAQTGRTKTIARSENRSTNRPINRSTNRPINKPRMKRDYLPATQPTTTQIYYQQTLEKLADQYPADLHQTLATLHTTIPTVPLYTWQDVTNLTYQHTTTQTLNRWLKDQTVNHDYWLTKAKQILDGDTQASNPTQQLALRLYTSQYMRSLSVQRTVWTLYGLSILIGYPETDMLDAYTNQTFTTGWTSRQVERLHYDVRLLIDSYLSDVDFGCFDGVVFDRLVRKWVASWVDDCFVYDPDGVYVAYRLP